MFEPILLSYSISTIAVDSNAFSNLLHRQIFPCSGENVIQAHFLSIPAVCLYKARTVVASLSLVQLLFL